MKRFLVVILFLLILTAAWFRWLDEIDPVTVKAEFASQKGLITEKMTDFDLKREIARIINALDAFFSPPKDDFSDEELVFEYLSTELNHEQGLSEPQEVLSTEESPYASEVVETTETLSEIETMVEVVSNESMGYPAPFMVPVTIVDAPEEAEGEEGQVEVGELMSEPASEQATDITVNVNNETSSTMAFNQLQDSIPGSFLPFNLQSVEPLYTTNFVHPEAGCDWMGVAGQIFDEDQQPVNGMVVVVEGVTNNSMVELLGFSGLAEAYGPGGYELVLSNVNGPGIFWIQLFGEDGKPLSEIYSFQMDGTCEQNLAVINFTVKTEVQSKFVPTVNP